VGEGAVVVDVREMDQIINSDTQALSVASSPSLHPLLKTLLQVCNSQSDQEHADIAALWTWSLYFHVLRAVAHPSGHYKNL